MARTSRRKFVLSKREKEVLDLLVCGMSNKQIAFYLSISNKTVEKHIASIYRKMGVRSRVEAVARAISLANEAEISLEDERLPEPDAQGSRDVPHISIRKSREIPHVVNQASPLKYRKISPRKRRTLMKKDDWFVAFITGVLLGLMAIGVGIPRLLSEIPSAIASNQMGEILSLVLNSHSQWSTAQGEAEITWYRSKGEIQAYLNEFVIYQPLLAYVDVKNIYSPGFNEILWISDGKNTYEINKYGKTYIQHGLPNFVHDLSVLPDRLAEIEDQVVYNHPFSLLIPAPVKEYIYPQWFAQGNSLDAYFLKGEENLLGRDTWVVVLEYKTGRATAWIDQKTGIILKYLQEESGQKRLEMHFTRLEIDAPVDADTFRVPFGYRLSENIEGGQK